MKCVHGAVAKILLVDDQQAQLDVWELQLREMPVEVLRATTYDRALQLATAERPQVALLDMVLEDAPPAPGGGG